MDAPGKEASHARRPLRVTFSLRRDKETPRATDHLADTVEFASVVLLTVICDEHNGAGVVKEAKNKEEDI